MSCRELIRSRRGFALPFVIFLVTLLTIVLATAFTRGSSEHLVVGSSKASIDALTIAQAGLETFFADTFTVRPAPTDSIRYNMVGGYTWVKPEILIRPADTTEDFTYIIRAAGFHIDPNQGTAPQAVRTVAQFARWQTGRLNVVAASTFANFVDRRPGGSVEFYSSDATDLTCVPTAFPPLVRMPADTISVSRLADVPAAPLPGQFLIGGADWFVAGETQIVWQDILNGVIVPDFITPQAGNTTFPIQLVNGNLTLPSGSYTGLLIVTGNLTVSGATVQWNGVVLVGGHATFDALANEIYGALVTGLNEQLGLVPAPLPPDTTLVGGNVFHARYNQCKIDRALQPLTGFVPLENAWVDNWATY